MRRFLLVTAFAVLMPASANAAVWVAVCWGKDVQFMHEIGGVGYFHIGANDGTYESQRLIQTYYDGKTVCAVADPKAPKISVELGQICVDKEHKVITVNYKPQAHAGPSPDAQTYCDARVKVH